MDRIKMYAQVIADKEAAVHNCWGSIDSTVCRPTVDQCEYYSEHKRHHCVQVPVSCNYPARRQGAYIFRENEIYYNQLVRKAVFGSDYFVVYGDQGYGLRQLVLTQFLGHGVDLTQQNFNRSMGTVRQAVEWGFQKVVSEFAFIEFKKNPKLLLQEIEEMYKTAVILTNCHTCLYWSEISQYFGIDPISSEQHLWQQGN